MRLYGRRWSSARLNHLDLNPWCVMCTALGRLTRASVVDHKTPHRGDEALFWDENNWQSLCKLCHDGAKQSQEKSGHLRGSDASGAPVDPAHHWNAA